VFNPKSIFIAAFTVLLLTGCGGGTNVQPQSLTLTSLAVSGSNLVYMYSDGTSVSKAITSTGAPTWASDHITKSTVYTLSDGSSDTLTETVAASVNKAYSVSSQTVTTTYGDGYSTSVTNTAISNSVAWASDHVTKTTTYTFADNEINPVVTIVSAAVTTAYSGNTQTVTSTYGDGHVSTTSNAAVSNSVSWASDHVTKTTTYTFPDATTNAEVATVNRTLVSTTYSGNAQTNSYSYGDGYSENIVTNASNTTATWDANADLQIAHTYPDGGSNTISQEFSWPDYHSYTQGQTISFQVTGGIISRQTNYASNSNASECCDTGTSITSAFDMSFQIGSDYRVDSASQSNSLGIINTTEWDGSGWGVGNFYAGASGDLISGDARGDTTMMMMTSNADDNMSVEHVTFGAWNCLFCIAEDGVEKVIAGAFYGPESSKLAQSSHPASGSFTFTGKSIGYAYSAVGGGQVTHATHVFRDFSSTVDFGASSVSYVNGDGSEPAVDFTGSSTIQGDGGFAGVVAFGDSSSGTIDGGFFGPSAVNVGGVFKRDDNTYIGSFGAAR